MLQRLKLIYKRIRKERIIREATKAKGGDMARNVTRRDRQASIRREKRAIIEGLITSWDLGEIRCPSKEIYDTLRFFYHGLTIEYLRSLEKSCWS